MTQLLDSERDLTVNEACAILHVTPPTVYKLLARNELDGYLVGRARRITAASVQRLRSGNPKGGRAA